MDGLRVFLYNCILITGLLPTCVVAGYVPRWPFKFGRTYQEECDICLEEFLSGLHKTKQLANETRALSMSQPSLRAINGDPDVRDKLNSYGDKKFTTSAGAVARTYQLIVKILKV